MPILKRTIEKFIKSHLAEKIILITGPRQCGKTTLSKALIPHHEYLSYDVPDDRETLDQRSWDRQKPLIIFDELHKMKNWKSYLKGIYDKEGIPPALVVTGSANLDTYRKMGDSLAGRYYRYRLHPFDLAELKPLSKDKPDEILNKLLAYSGFPEPYLKGSEQAYGLWKKTHLDIMIRQDILDLEAVKHIKAIELLVQKLRRCVGSTVSYASLARDLQFSPQTIQHWLQILENLYIIFRVSPYSTNISRSLLKEPKYYFYDTAFVLGDDGQKFENLVACSLLKKLHFLEDTEGSDVGLFYCRTKDGDEVDFLTVVKNQQFTLIEVKWSDSTLSKSLTKFKEKIPNAKAIQLVKNLDREKTFPNGCEIRAAENWLVDPLHR